MATKMRIRARLKGDVTAITAIIRHPMETGLRKDSKGELIPAHFIQLLTLDVGGKRVIESQLNTSVSTNPVFNFKFKGAKVGDKVTIAWVDNKGEKGSGEGAVTEG